MDQQRHPMIAVWLVGWGFVKTAAATAAAAALLPLVDKTVPASCCQSQTLTGFKQPVTVTQQ